MFEIVLFAAFFVFYCHLASEWEARHNAPEPAPLPELMDTAAALAQKPVPAMAADMERPDEVMIIPADDGPEYSAMSSQQMRKECQAVGIAWRDARGKGKHMLKAEMVAELLLTDI
jgi:hypothetical protein